MQAFKKWLLFTGKRFDWIEVFSQTYKTTRAPLLRFTLARFALLPTVMLVVSGCIASQSTTTNVAVPPTTAIVAGQWTTTNIYTGTATDIPVGVAVRDFGPTGDVVFVVERRDGPNGSMPHHFLTMLHSVCSAGGCAPVDWPPVQVPPADQMLGLGDDQYYNASLALKGTVVPSATLDSAHIVRRTGPTTQCGSRQLNLSEEEYLFASTTWNHHNIDTNAIGNCQDRQISYTLESGGMLYSCWTQDPTSGGGDNQVWCSARLIAGGLWNAPILLADGVTIGGDQDHPWFDFDPVNALRYIVHRNRDANPDIITLRVPEPGTVGDMPQGLMGVPQNRDMPAIARAADGSMYAVWHAPTAGGHIRYARCPAILNCTQAVNWAPPVEIRTAPSARHAEIMITGNGRLMIMWMEKDDNLRDRIHFKETCQGTAWPVGGGQVPRPATGLPVDQSNYMGRPHITIDNTHSLVHLGFVEFDNPGNPTGGDVYWARKTFADCP